MNYAIRLLRCILGVSSPSLVMIGGPHGVDWLSRWERRINDAQRERVAAAAREMFDNREDGGK